MNIKYFFLVALCLLWKGLATQECYPLPLMNWEPRNHAVLQELIQNYGKGGEHYSPSSPSYAVFDWDNTSIFHDCGDATFYFQIQNLKLKLTPDELRALLLDEIHGVKTLIVEGTSYQLADLNADILSAYRYLYAHFEGFKGTVSLREMQETDAYLDFVSKILFLYENYEQAKEIGPFYSYIWVGKFLAHFSLEETHALAKDALRSALTEPLGKKLLQSTSKNYSSKAGPVKTSIDTGIRTRGEMQSLMALLKDAGVDVYVISGSFKPILEVFAGQESLGYNVPSDHIFGLELEEKEGRFLPALKKGSFLTFGKGKADTIMQVFGSKAPLLVCGDNDNDYYMLTLPQGILSLLINRCIPGKIQYIVQEALHPKDRAHPRYLLQGIDLQLGIFISSTGAPPAALQFLSKAQKE